MSTSEPACAATGASTAPATKVLKMLRTFTTPSNRSSPRWARLSVKAGLGVLTKSYFRRSALILPIALAACTTAEPLGGPLVAEVAAPTPTAALQRIARNAARCWKDGEIGRYAVIPELDTQAGKPRILLIEKGKPRSLPALVIEGEGGPTRLRSFGPLASAPLSNRINADVIRWSTGNDACGDRA